MLEDIKAAIAKGYESLESLKAAHKKKPMNPISTAITMQELFIRDLTKLAKDLEENPPKVEVKEETPAAEENSEKKSE